MDDRLRRALELADLPLLRAADVDVDLSDIEARIGCRLPSVFREFLAVQNALEMLKRFSNCDLPISLNRLGVSVDGDDFVQDRILPFMIENQGVCTWAVALDGADDPRVLIEVDSMPTPRWELNCESFADWLECQIADHSGQPRFAAQANALTVADMSTLEAGFQRGLETYAWPGKTNYRFSNARMKLLLWNTSATACDWWITPMPGVSDEAIIDELKQFNGLADAIYPIGPDA